MHESIYSYWFTSSWIHAEITLKSICGYLDRSVGSCNTLNDLPNKVCDPNKTEDLSLIVSNVITEIKESKTLTKHTSCKCKCKYDGVKVIQIKIGITIDVHVSVKIWKNIICTKKIIFEIQLHIAAKIVNI